MNSAWVAGLFDAEGTVTMTKGKNLDVRAFLGMNDHELVRSIAEAYSHASLTSMNGGKALLATWTGLSAYHLLTDIAPFLVLKKERALLGIHVVGDLGGKHGNRLQREEALGRFRWMNKRGSDAEYEVIDGDPFTNDVDFGWWFSGYMRGDGHVGKTTIGIASVHRASLYVIQKRIGGRIYTRPSKGNARAAYQLMLTGDAYKKALTYL